MKSNKLLWIAAILIGIGIVKPNVSNILITPHQSTSVIEKPDDPQLLEASKAVINALSNNSDRKYDGKKLSELYNDMATLIELDHQDKVIHNTAEIEQANTISGTLLKLDIKGKYPDLPEAAKNIIVIAIGDDIVELDDNLRNKAVSAFRALSWACLEGSK